MTLIERWEDSNEETVVSEIRNLFANYSNAVSLFTVDGNHDPIRYCVEHSENTEIETYGKRAGVCYSEKIARACIEHILTDFGFLLFPFFRNKLPVIDICVRNLPIPVAYSKTENGEENEIREAVFSFEGCSNQAGFCVSRIIPLF